MSPVWRSWLNRFLSRPCTVRNGWRCARLRLEALEARLAPAVYNVTTVTDVVNPNDGVLSLREAVLAANTSVGVPDTINLPAGTYTLTLTGAAEDATATGDLDLWDDVTIQGAGTGTTIVDGNATDRVFDVSRDGDAGQSHQIGRAHV